MRHESRSVKEGSHENEVRDASLAGPEMKRATRTTLEAWGGMGLVVIASVMMKLSMYSALRTVVFVVVILIATGLIVRSLGGGSRDEEE
jgi:hypothetical protein